MVVTEIRKAGKSLVDEKIDLDNVSRNVRIF